LQPEIFQAFLIETKDGDFDASRVLGTPAELLRWLTERRTPGDAAASKPAIFSRAPPKFRPT
jgi:hypothetical protein